MPQSTGPLRPVAENRSLGKPCTAPKAAAVTPQAGCDGDAREAHHLRSIFFSACCISGMYLRSSRGDLQQAKIPMP